VHPRVLVVDDEPQIRRVLRTALGAEGYGVQVAATGAEALDLLAAGGVDLVVLDLGLPDMDGAELCTSLRQWSAVPVIVLSVRESEAEKVRALDRGADDYLVKPFGIAELLARVRAALRRAREEVGQPLVRHEELEIDLARHRVCRSGREVHLTPTEYELLAYLAAHRGKVLTHQMILTRVWGPEYEDEVQYLRVFVSQLRRKIEEDPRNPRHLLTELGVGYRFPADS
jgi:two-component system KDP operon response regulator KdpE